MRLLSRQNIISRQIKRANNFFGTEYFRFQKKNKSCQIWTQDLCRPRRICYSREVPELRKILVNYEVKTREVQFKGLSSVQNKKGLKNQWISISKKKNNFFSSKMHHIDSVFLVFI